MNHQPKAWVSAVPPRKPHRFEMTRRNSDESRIFDWDDTILKAITCRRVQGAGNRNAISGSVNATPGFESGTTHANNALTRRITAPRSASRSAPIGIDDG